MSKICAKCEKPVYPTEELKCLDKVWHKACFKCWECGMTLNMKNYKGYEKKPYCVAFQAPVNIIAFDSHYPQTKATVVAETPEMARLTQASKNQSQNVYHEAFEKDKGKYTAIVDDPETMRLVKNQEAISMAKYHEEFEKKIKGSKIQVADDPETQRLKQLNTIVSQVEYKGLKEKVTDMETRRQNVGQSDPDHSRPQSGTSDETAANLNWSSPYSERNASHSTVYSTAGKVEHQQTRKIGSISDYEPTPGPAAASHSVYQPIGATSRQRQEWEETVPISGSTPYQHLVTQQQLQQVKEQQMREQQLREQQLREQQVREQQLKEQQMREQQLRDQQVREQQLKEQQMREQQLRDQQIREQQLREQQLKEQQMREQQLRDQQIRDQQLRDQQAREQQFRDQQLRDQQARDQQLRDQHLREQQLREQQQIKEQQIRDQQQLLREQQMREQQMREQQMMQQQAYMNQNQQATRVPPVSAPLSGGFAGPVFQAMYDYDAQDDDEVSFRENDLVVNVEPIDEGWMFGTIQRTGMRGMLPANYVERIK